MVEANIRRLSRMELIYKCISKLVTWLHKNGHDDLIKTKEHYYDPSDFNVVIYHCRSTDTNDRIQVLLDDIDFLLDRCDHVSDSQMLKDHISDIGHQDEQVTLAADGAYSGIENKELAAKFQH